ncbi:hypothetical protein M8818_002003 [Zalaria obscura]|uniref:Uncharacterized protein n=1 Tax=Zalaria obscura TaxID=2024903 RepID=A0ACC3SIN3_9PEZI
MEVSLLEFALMQCLPTSHEFLGPNGSDVHAYLRTSGTASTLTETNRRSLCLPSTSTHELLAVGHTETQEHSLSYKLCGARAAPTSGRSVSPSGGCRATGVGITLRAIPIHPALSPRSVHQNHAPQLRDLCSVGANPVSKKESDHRLEPHPGLWVGLSSLLRISQTAMVVCTQTVSPARMLNRLANACDKAGPRAEATQCVPRTVEVISKTYHRLTTSPLFLSSKSLDCQNDVANNILVDPNGDEYQCSDTDLQPDDTPEMSTCPMQKDDMWSGDWSVILISNNGDGTPIAYERDFSLTVGVPSTVWYLTVPRRHFDLDLDRYVHKHEDVYEDDTIRDYHPNRDRNPSQGHINNDQNSRHSQEDKIPHRTNLDRRNPHSNLLRPRAPTDAGPILQHHTDDHLAPHRPATR